MNLFCHLKNLLWISTLYGLLVWRTWSEKLDPESIDYYMFLSIIFSNLKTSFSEGTKSLSNTHSFISCSLLWKISFSIWNKGCVLKYLIKTTSKTDVQAVTNRCLPHEGEGKILLYSRVLQKIASENLSNKCFLVLFIFAGYFERVLTLRC